MVFCTEFLGGWWSLEPLRKSCVDSIWNVMAHGDSREEVKGKLGNAVGSQYPSHYLGTWCIQHYYRWCAHLGCQYSTELTPIADLNGLVRFAERRFLVSARVSSHFNWPQRCGLCCAWVARHHPENRCRKSYATTQHLMLLMMGVCTRNILS